MKCQGGNGQCPNQATLGMYCDDHQQPSEEGTRGDTDFERKIRDDEEKQDEEKRSQRTRDMNDPDY